MGEQVSCNYNVRGTTRKQDGIYQHKPYIYIETIIFIQEASFKYWPNKEESMTFGNFSIELVSDDPENKLVIRRIMKVTNTKEVTSLFKNL